MDDTDRAVILLIVSCIVLVIGVGIACYSLFCARRPLIVFGKKNSWPDEKQKAQIPVTLSSSTSVLKSNLKSSSIERKSEKITLAPPPPRLSESSKTSIYFHF